MTDKSKAKGGAAAESETKAPEKEATETKAEGVTESVAPTVSVEALVAGFLADDGFRAQVAEACKGAILGLLEPVQEDLRRFAQLAEEMPPVPTASDILAADGFADGVAQIVTVRVQSDDFPATIKPAIDAYLGIALPELVAAAMPETPEAKAERQAKAAADAQAARQRADRKAQGEREKADSKERALREERKAMTRETRKSLMSGEGRDAEPVDLSKVKRGTMMLDDGDHLSIDFTREVHAGQLERGDGNALLLKAPPIKLGDGMPEGFRAEAVLLVLELEEGHRVLRCPMQSPVLIGGGATAQLGEDSLMFRPI